MMAKMGFRAGGALGKAPSPSAPGGDGDAVEKKDKNDADDRLFEPLRPEVRDGRGGIGLDSDRKRRLGEAAEDRSKKLKVDENEFRDRMRKDQMRGRLERQVHAAMKVCERMDDERGSGGAVAVEEDDEDDENDDEIEEKKKNKNKPFSTRPLKSIPVVWRGLARSREEAERDRRMRHDLEQSSSIAATRRLPTYEDDLSDDDDRVAMGREARPAAYAPVEDLDEDDAELDEFAALEPEERLRRLVVFLRDEHRYCFWCKCGYPDDDMDGCPGPTEEDHD
ncbi:hypothetical protein GGR52DRAFT_540321 [Hypoxylon sp. FL1284]|nr:hypothetical protein GGR52DRAFT_540321 [Hypoxylon sp. FL1284]